MTLIKSISGIRGTIGGLTKENLTPLDVVRFTTAYAQLLKEKNKSTLTVVTGRDARISGPMIHSLVNQTLVGMGVNVINLELSTTPTVAVAVPMEKADGGIIITASHNPKEWNALKLLNSDGEFINHLEGIKIKDFVEFENPEYSKIDFLGNIIKKENYIDKHIEKALKLKHINSEIIKRSNFKVVVDGVNSTGGIAVPRLLRELNVEVVELNCLPNGLFSHNPEPIEENLSEICNAVKQNNADLGIAVDPDVDRLVFVDEKGDLFGEEYTLVACADFILSKEKGATVSNLSSTRALADITNKHGGKHTYSAVGELNVVSEMKKVKAIIGGEGNGGVILPELHYGRDAIVGILLFLSLMAEKKISVSELKATYPHYYMTKDKIALKKNIDLDKILSEIALKYKNEKLNIEDGLKIDFNEKWVHLRKSNTESIIRIYSEAKTKKIANELSLKFLNEIRYLT